MDTTYDENTDHILFHGGPSNQKQEGEHLKEPPNEQRANSIYNITI